MAYSLDLRKKVIDYRKKHTLEETHLAFNISISTILDWEVLQEETGSLKKRPLNRSFKKIDPIALAEFIIEFPDSYLHEIAEHFNCTTTAVFYALNNQKITLKKLKFDIVKRMRKNVKHSKKDLAELESKRPDKSVFYVDETGIDKHIYRPNVRAVRGQKIYSKIRGQKFERLSIVAGKCKDKIVAPMVFKGTADSTLFEYWFESCFCPEIAGNIAILDNASIHRKEKLHKIAQKYNVILIFQPPYSPDLNKIEKFWAWMKKQLRSTLKIFDTLFDAIYYCFQLK